MKITVGMIVVVVMCVGPMVVHVVHVEEGTWGGAQSWQHHI